MRRNPDDAALLRRGKVTFGTERGHYGPDKDGISGFATAAGFEDPDVQKILPDWRPTDWVADADFRIWSKDGETFACASIQHIHTVEQFRRKGVMSAIYRAVEQKYGATIVMCDRQSGDGVAFWRGGRFVSRGRSHLR